MTEQKRLQQMTDELRHMRERCEPQSNQNPRYLRFSNAVSALLWIIDDLEQEQAGGADLVSRCGYRSTHEAD